MSKTSFSIDLDFDQNLVIIQVKGYHKDTELQAMADVIMTKVATLKPGMKVINDISEMKPATQ